MHTIEVINGSKEIKGAKVLNDIKLKLQGGRIYGFVGRNGSGKSMLFRMLAGLIYPTKGTIIIDGKELYKEINRVERVGVVIENTGLYQDLTGAENLIYLAKINDEIGKDEIRESMERVGLDFFDKRILKKYSLGMKQKIVIAQAIMEKPDFLFLDEPTNALDEQGIQLLRKIVMEEAARGAIVLVASHNKTDIELLCDTVYLMEEGKLSTLPKEDGQKNEE